MFMGLNKLTILTHTHSDCKDLWDPYFDSYKEFFKEVEHIVLINRNSSEIKLKQIVYDDTISHSDRFIIGVESIDSEFVLISLEDMILYDKVVENEIVGIIDMMSEDKSIMYTRLIKSGIHSSVNFSKNMFKLENTDFLLSITPTIWNRELLLNTLHHLRGLSIWNLELNGDKLLKDQNIKAFYYYNNEPKRGGHYDSSIYPHICSAICKGKWNLSEYKTELSPIINKYNINVNDRGIF
jgi:hypothetical protein